MIGIVILLRAYHISAVLDRYGYGDLFRRSWDIWSDSFRAEGRDKDAPNSPRQKKRNNTSRLVQAATATVLESGSLPGSLVY